MAHEPDPGMWETHVWRTLATELFIQLAEEKKFRAFGVDLNPGLRRRPVTITTTPHTASLEFEEQAPMGPDDGGRTDRCVECGSTRVSYENYKGQLFCWPCADGQPQPRHPRANRVTKANMDVRSDSPEGAIKEITDKVNRLRKGGIISDS